MKVVVVVVVWGGGREERAGVSGISIERFRSF